MANAEIIEALKEVLPFLKWHSPFDYKREVLDNLLGITGTSDGLLCLSKNRDLMKSLSQLIIEDRSRDIQERALKIIVNSTTTAMIEPIQKDMLRNEVLDAIFALMLNKSFPCANYCAMLLANLTNESTSCETVYNSITKNNNTGLENLLTVFCDVKYNEHCDLEHIGSLLANLTLLKQARLEFLNKEKSMFKRILPFTQYTNSSVRRYSAAAIIKNCLFETEYHECLLSDELELLTFLLLPLTGPEEIPTNQMEELPLDLQYLPPDKTREPSRSIQILLIECLFQLCATKPCRLKLKDSGVYYILREFDNYLGEDCDDGKIRLPLENTIQVLIGDEPEEGQENLRTIEIPDHIKKHFAEEDAARESEQT